MRSYGADRIPPSCSHRSASSFRSCLTAVTANVQHGLQPDLKPDARIGLPLESTTRPIALPPRFIATTMSRVSSLRRVLNSAERHAA